MKTSQFIGAVVLSILGVTAAQAESYQGVQTINSTLSRAEVASQARVAARNAAVFGEAEYDGVQAVLNSNVDRAAVRSAAVQTARQGNVYGDAYGQGALVAGQADRATVRAQARAAARGNTAL